MKLIANLHALLRCVLICLHILLGTVLIIVYRVRFGRRWFVKPGGLSIKRWWMLTMNSLLGLRVAQYGQIDRQPLLYVANHVSFLDILVISAVTDVRFLSKHSVRYWPLVGVLATMSGTLYIRRGKRNLIARVVKTLSHALTHSHVVVFPEGTTSLGEDVRHFHSGLFQAAIDAKVPVQPIAIRYLHLGKLDRTAAYIENDNILVTLWRLLERSYTDVHLIFTQTLASDDKLTRQELAHQAQTQIHQQLRLNRFVDLR